MSNVGQGVLAVVGAVIGWFIGGPTGAAYGFQLGLLAGTALFPTQLPAVQGPRLGEGLATQTTVGSPIPIIRGTQKVGGIIIWASPIREVSNTDDVGGKGSPEQSQTTYTYYRSWAVLLCEGPIDGVRRIWFNGKLVYDKKPPTWVVNDPTDPVVQEWAAGQAATRQIEERMTLYLGTEDQLPDPVIETFEGVGEISAYRGYAYAVFDDVQLKPEDGNRIPTQMMFEVYEDGEENDIELRQYSNEVIYPWIQNSIDPRNPKNAHTYVTAGFQNPLFQPTFPGGTHEFNNLSSAVNEFVDAFNADFRTPFGRSALSDADLKMVAMNEESYPHETYPIDTGIPGEGISAQIHFNELTPGSYEAAVPGGGGTVVTEYLIGKGKIWFETDANAEAGVAFADEAGQCIVFDHPSIATLTGTNIVFAGQETYETPDMFVVVKRVAQAPPSPCGDVNAVPLPDMPGYCAIDGIIHKEGDWIRDDSTTYHVLQRFQTSGGGHPAVVKYPLNPARPLGHSQYNDEDFWESSYALAVARGDMPAGLVYGVDYPESQSFGYYIDESGSSVNVHSVSLADIVRGICARVALTEDDIDVSDLEDIDVYGYTMARQMAARGGIETLRSYGFFDVVESGTKLKFVTRGKAAVATLTDEDLGARFVTDDRVSMLSTQKLQERELPLQVRVMYQDIDLDLDPGQALSPARLDTQAETVATIELPVAMTNEEAMKKAEVIMRDTWASRWTHQIQVDQSRSNIEPADAIVVPVDGRTQRMRVTSITDKLPNLRVFELVRDDDGTYVSYAVGSSVTRQPTRIPFYAPAVMTILDIPALRDADNDGGFYVAFYPAVAIATFRGASVYKSNDGGQSYQSIVAADSAVTVGTLLEDLPYAAAETWDEGNRVLVELSHGSLESRIESAVLAGANALAIGADGRWNIVQFRDAEVVSGSVYSLAGLLQGRRGTEHNIGTCIAGDKVVLLSAGGLVRVPINVAEVNAVRQYKAVAVGNSVATTASQEFTARGVALRPFSPVHIEGDWDGNDVTISWTRRDRMQIDYVPGADTVMSEQAEDYEVEIVDVHGDALRVISVSEQSAVYTEAQNITDFGSFTSTFSVKVYQISAAVGRGYAGEAII